MRKEGITQGHSIVLKDGLVIFKLLVATPASGISPHNTSYGCQALCSHHTSTVTVRLLRITTGRKQLRDTFISSSSFGRLLSFWIHQKHLTSVSSSISYGEIVPAAVSLKTLRQQNILRPFSKVNL